MMRFSFRNASGEERAIWASCLEHAAHHYRAPLWTPYECHDELMRIQWRRDELPAPTALKVDP